MINEFLILAFIAGTFYLLYFLIKKKPDKQENFSEIRSNGVLVDLGNPGGRIGMSYYKPGTLSYEIYTTAIIFHPSLTGSDFSLKKEEITDLKYEKSVTGRPVTVIKHTSLNVEKDIILYCKIDKSILLNRE